MGTARSFGRAYGKAQTAAGNGLPDGGVAVVDLEVDGDGVAGFEAYYDVRSGDEVTTAADDADGYEDLPAAVRDGAVDLLVSDDSDALRTAVEAGVPYFSTVAAVEAALKALSKREEPLDVAPLGERPKRDAEWGR